MKDAEQAIEDQDERVDRSVAKKSCVDERKSSKDGEVVGVGEANFFGWL